MLKIVAWIAEIAGWMCAVVSWTFVYIHDWYFAGVYFLLAMCCFFISGFLDGWHENPYPRGTSDKAEPCLDPGCVRNGGTDECPLDKT